MLFFREILGPTTGPPKHVYCAFDKFHYFAGLYLSGFDGKLPQGDRAAIRKHLQLQMNLNFNFLVYSLTTELAIAYNSQSIEACASVTYMLCEIAYRVFSVYLL